MAGELTVIYTARTPVEARQLQNLLAEAGIEAMVSNEALKGGLGGDILGWSVQPRVVVAAEHAELARRIALQFDEEVEALSGSLGYDPGEGDPPAGRPEAWPRCPACGALRVTRCPDCGGEGTDYAEVDPDFVGMVDVDAEATPMSCGCGSGGSCGGGAEAPAEAGTEGADGAESAEAADQPAVEPPRLVLLCPTCDDPFVPEYARRCRSCGHEFPDGYEPAPERRADERLSAQAVAMIVGLIVVLLGLVVYFALIL